MADDLGYGDLGSYGQELLETPRLDQMAAEGVRFTQYCAGSAACTPSRYALVMGKHAGTTRVVTNKIFSLPEGIFNIARLLQDAGYRNQRLAHDYYPEYLMENRGFVELTGNVTSDNKQVAKLKAVNTAGRVHQAALDFIKRNRDRLFYLQLDYNLPDVNKYLERIGNSGFEQDGPGRYVNEDWDAREKGYGEMVGLMDDYLGELIAQLRYLGIDNNTLVIFTSDNGPAGTRGMESFDRFNATGGLRGNKGKLWESKTPVKKLVCCDRTRSWVSRSVI